MGIGPIRIGRPSPAMLVAIVALFVALGGTGYGALSGKDKKRVKAIVDREIAAKASGLTVANANALGGAPAGEFQKRLWAVVRSDGTLARGVGAVSSSGVAGNYEVKFNRDITGCAFGVTIGGSADASESFGIAEAQITSLTNGRDSVTVFTESDSGGLTNRGFHLIVDC